MERGKQPGMEADDIGARIALAVLADIFQRHARETEFASGSLPLCAMSRLVCNAIGRGGAGDAPEPRPSSDGGIDVFVALESGLYWFEPVRMGLHATSSQDIRVQFSTLDALPPAPVNLIYVARLDLRRIRLQQAAAIAAIKTSRLCERVSRFCAQEGLACCVRGWLDRASLAASMQLGRYEQLMFVQSVGYPAGAAGAGCPAPDAGHDREPPPTGNIRRNVESRKMK